GVFDTHDQTACESAEQQPGGRGPFGEAVEGVDRGKQRCGDSHVRGDESAVRENVGFKDEKEQCDGSRDIAEHLARFEKDKKREREGEDGYREAGTEKELVRIVGVQEDPAAERRCSAE